MSPLTSLAAPRCSTSGSSRGRPSAQAAAGTLLARSCSPRASRSPRGSRWPRSRCSAPYRGSRDHARATENRTYDTSNESPHMRLSLLIRGTLGLLLILGLGCSSCSHAPRAPVETARAQACPEGMILIPATTFTMGVGPGRAFYPWAGPPHEVTLSAYCIDRLEVTAADFARCPSSACDAAGVDREPGQWCTHAATQPNHPRNCVTWDNAVAYCAYRGGRLPTAAEWEHAARGPEGFLVPWGTRDLEPTYTAYPATTQAVDPVGSFPEGRSPYGLEDTVGSVAEWVHDWFAPYDAAPASNPRGPASRGENGREIRGGAWDDNPHEYLSAVERAAGEPTTRRHAVGFRCADTPR